MDGVEEDEERSGWSGGRGGERRFVCRKTRREVDGVEEEEE